MSILFPYHKMLEVAELPCANLIVKEKTNWDRADKYYLVCKLTNDKCDHLGWDMWGKQYMKESVDNCPNFIRKTVEDIVSFISQEIRKKYREQLELEETWKKLNQEEKEHSFIWTLEK